MSPQEFLKKFSSEPRLIPLENLAVGKLNRGGKPLNGAHVMSLMMRFHKGSAGGGEDFQAYRYKPARVYEPNPEDPHEAAVHTNQMAARDSRIRPVQDHGTKGLYSLFSKSHMWSALWGTVSRSVRSSSDPESSIFVPPVNQPDFLLAEKHGLWCEVVSWQGVRDHPDVLSQLMKIENYDASSALAEDEMTLLGEIHQRLAAGGGIDVLKGEREYDAFLRHFTSLPGQVFSERDVECRYNLAKVLGTVHIEFLQNFGTVSVDFKLISVSSKCIQALTTLPPQCPWLKVCPLMDNYMTLDPKTVVGGKGIVDNWSASTVDEITAEFDESEELQSIEKTVCNLITKYRVENCPGASAELLHKTQCRLAFRTGAILRGKKRGEWESQLAEVEHKLRQKLPKGIPQPVLSAKLVPAPKAAASSLKNVSGSLDQVPALSVDALGRVTQNIACRARQGVWYWVRLQDASGTQSYQARPRGHGHRLHCH